MTRLTISSLSAAAMLGSALALASPAIGQEVIQYPAACAQMYPLANCLNYGPGNPFNGSYQLNPWASASPGGAFAYDTGVYEGDYYGGYAAYPAPRFACAPGTSFRGPDGHRHLCR